MLKITFSSYLLAFWLFNFFSSSALAQLPDFGDIDANNDGLIDEIEYKQFFNSQEENSNLSETEEEEKSDEPDKLFSLGQSFIDTANIIIPTCTALNQCAATEPAIFGYTITEGEDVFSVNAAIAINLADRRFDISDGAKRYTNLIVEPVIEANVSSADSTSNYVRAAIPFIFSFNDTATLFPVDRRRYKIPERPQSFFQQHNLILIPKYESDREFDSQTIGLDLLYTPTIPDLGIGAAIRDGRERNRIGFLWRPVIGVEFGNVINNNKNLATLSEDTFARATARLGAELSITKALAFNADYAFFLDLTGDLDFYDFVELSLQYFFDERQNISVGLEYVNGGRSPTFEDAEFLRSFFGLRF